jgi:hypothetical protein
MRTGIDASNVTSDTLQKVTQAEVYHYQHILQQPVLQDRYEFKHSKESHVHVLLHELCRHVRQIDQWRRADLKL